MRASLSRFPKGGLGRDRRSAYDANVEKPVGNDPSIPLPPDVTDMAAHAATASSVRALQDAYRSLLPGKEVRTLLTLEGPEAGEAARDAGWPLLAVPSPSESAAALDARIRAGGFHGVAADPSHAPVEIPPREVRIIDILPFPHLEALESLSAVILLRLPRGGDLQDPLNLAQILEIEGRFRRLSLVVVGALNHGLLPDALRRTQRTLFDTSAAGDREAALRLLDGAGPRRIVFAGGLEDGIPADAASFRGRIRALQEALAARGLSAADGADLFGGNAQRVLGAADPSARRAQLQMVWPAGRRLPRMPRLPQGYALRTWRDGDAEGYRALMQAAGFESWAGEDRVRKVLKAALPEGLFFVVHEATGRIVATTLAGHGPIEQHPFGGELGWVAVDPAHRGRRLSAVTCAAVVRRFLQAGFSDIFLRTDDHRLPALRIYLDLGFVPFLHQPDMEGRWRKVFLELGMDWDRSGAAAH